MAPAKYDFAELDRIVLGNPKDFVLARPVGEPDDPDSTPAYRSVLSEGVGLVNGWPGAGIDGVSAIFDKGREVAAFHGKKNMYCYKDRIYERDDPQGKIAGFSDWKWTTWDEFHERRLDFGSGLIRLFTKLTGKPETERFHFSLFSYNRPEWIVCDHGGWFRYGDAGRHGTRLTS